MGMHVGADVSQDGGRAWGRKSNMCQPSVKDEESRLIMLNKITPKSDRRRWKQGVFRESRAGAILVEGSSGPL